jgi:hypothetical protein
VNLSNLILIIFVFFIGFAESTAHSKTSSLSNYAQNLVELTFTRHDFENALQKVEGRILKTFPSSSRKKILSKKFADYHFMREKLVDIYSQSLTEAEMQEFISFYQSAKGKRILGASKKISVAFERLLELSLSGALDD